MEGKPYLVQGIGLNINSDEPGVIRLRRRILRPERRSNLFTFLIFGDLISLFKTRLIKKYLTPELEPFLAIFHENAPSPGGSPVIVVITLGESSTQSTKSPKLQMRSPNRY
jgi:hypothetical protein